MKGRSARMALDGALTILLIASMLAQLTGVIAHEIIGVVFLIAVVAHIVNSFWWMKTVARLVENAQVKGGQLALFVVAVLLGVTVALLAVSSVPISRLLYQVGLAPKVMSSMWLAVHKVSAFLLCILAVVHLAMHWVSILKHLNIPFDPSKRKAIGLGVKAISCAGIVALGVVGFNSLELFAGLGENADGEGSREGSTSQPASGSQASSASTPQGEGSPSTSGASEGLASASSSSASADAQPAKVQADAGDGEAGSSEGDAEALCPLCRKHCPLSDPQCDKPYLAGLIAS
ncbi:DUF4405 domain-containing protein [uncultured Ellagibacter sp.]|uniref:DUF4405 domain-containing protein n=1 Tax=uncultured Ellagibacter sp. TaxID=2137580 RepID=UPI0025E52F59|nr:DUF4405 domain-containing protein [uncultured Ellagibacter sp.]